MTTFIVIVLIGMLCERWTAYVSSKDLKETLASVRSKRDHYETLLYSTQDRFEIDTDAHMKLSNSLSNTNEHLVNENVRLRYLLEASSQFDRIERMTSEAIQGIKQAKTLSFKAKYKAIQEITAQGQAALNVAQEGMVFDFNEELETTRMKALEDSLQEKES